MTRRQKYELKHIKKTVRFTIEEYTKLSDMIDEADSTFSEFVRFAVFDTKLPTPKIEREYLKEITNLKNEINKIGINVNQIAKKINSEDLPTIIKKEYATQLLKINKNLENLEELKNPKKSKK